MGFDNECIANIQSLPGEYFCPVCRTLVYPNEAMQSACTHLYCKPCLSYIVATTSACPYDGYLVSEKDAKPLVESGKAIADAIGNIQVHCLYNRSGCQWQGTLTECITHCANCTFGNSPVVCNRCGTQIVHRQVQEHAQTCPGVQPQGQSVQNQSGVQSVPPTSQIPYSQPAATATSGVASSAAPVQDPSGATMATTVAVQGHPSASSQQQAAVQPLTQEQWSQQYQQYYQQYPGYDPYQQQYQQYGYHHQQAQQQPLQTYGQPHSVQGQQHSQANAQQYPHTVPQSQAQQQYPPIHGQQTHAYPQTFPQLQVHSQGQTVPARPQMHVAVQPTGQQNQNPQLHAHALPHTQLPHMQHPSRPIQQHMMVQSQQQPSHALYQSHPSFHGQALTPAPIPQLHEQSRVYSRPHSVSQPPIQPQMQSQSLRPPHLLNQPLSGGQNQPLSQSQPLSQLQSPSAQLVTGHQSFPQPHLQSQMPVAGVGQHPVQMNPARHGPLHPQQHHHQFLTPNQSQMWAQQQARHSSPLPQTQNHVQHPTNIQASQHHMTSNYQPQISSFHNQVQHSGSFPPQNLHHQGQHPKPQLQPNNQMTIQSALENSILSHQQSKTAPDDVAVQLHGLPSESESVKAMVPSSSPSSLKLSKEELNSGAALPNPEIPSLNSAVMHDGSSVQNADNNKDGNEEDKRDEQSEPDYGGGHADGEASDKSVHLEETRSKTDGDDRTAGHGPGHTVNSGKIQRDNSRSPSQTLPNQVQSSGDSIDILPPTDVQTNSEYAGPSPHQPRSLIQHQDRDIQLASHVPAYMKDTSSQMPNIQQMPYLAPQQEKMFQEKSPQVSSHVQQLTSNKEKPSLLMAGNNTSSGFHGYHAPFAAGPPSLAPPVVSQLQSHVPPVPSYDASVLPLSSHVEPFSGAPLPGQPVGPVVSMNAAVPFIHTEGQQFRSLQPGPYDGSRVDRIHSIASDSFASGNQGAEMSKMISTNGFLGHSSSYLSHALGSEKFMLDENPRTMATEGLGRLADPHFTSFRDPPRRVIDRRKLEEDLKEFPRPSELDSQAGAKFGTPSAAPFGMSFDRGIAELRPDGPPGVRVHSPVSSRSMPFYMTGISNNGSLPHQMESVDWRRLSRAGSEFDSKRLDSGHLSRSPGSELSGLPSNRFGTGSLDHRFGGSGHAESFGPDTSGMLPNHVRMGNGIIPGMRGGGSTGFDVMPRNMPGDDRFGAMAGNFNNHLHFDDYPIRDFSGHNDYFQSGYGSLDNSRKRRESSTGWCLICDIYCESDEGRNLHFQTMEHQNRTMDIVLSIKQRYSKKLILSSEERESNKLQKADVGGHPNRR